MHIGVIGAGMMGNGIAHVAALAGHRVTMVDVDVARARAGLAAVERSLARRVARGALEPGAAEQTLARITPVGDQEGLADADMVIEAATEEEGLKRRIFSDLSRKVAPECILATNTSSISITMLAAGTERPERCLGVHFFNPVPVMRLVEIIPALQTSPETLAAAHAFCEGLGKEVIEAQDSPAFIVNRMLCPMMNEAIFALGEGIGSIEDIDMGMRLGANHPMGPLQLADFVGLDTLHAIMTVMAESTGDPKYRPAPLLAKYMEAGWFGKKSGRGFYDYSGERPVPTR